MRLRVNDLDVVLAYLYVQGIALRRDAVPVQLALWLLGIRVNVIRIDKIQN